MGISPQRGIIMRRYFLSSSAAKSTVGCAVIFQMAYMGVLLSLLKWRKRSAARRLLRIVEPKPFRGLIVPGGVYGGDGAIFVSENSIFQSKNRFLAVSAPENP